MELKSVKPPKLLKGIFPNYIWGMPLTLEKTLYLTFDDGPIPEITPWVLKTLKTYKAKATFFCIGDNVKKHPDIFKTITEGGHAVGNHTFNHLKGWNTPTETYIENAEKASNLIPSNLFRPPYGKIKRSQAKQLRKQGYNIIMWSVIAFDWDQKLSQEACLKNVIANATDGDIIVFHDSKKAANNMQYALPKVLEYFSNKGFVFKTLNVK